MFAEAVGGRGVQDIEEIGGGKRADGGVEKARLDRATGSDHGGDLGCVAAGRLVRLQIQMSAKMGGDPSKMLGAVDDEWIVLDFVQLLLEDRDFDGTESDLVLAENGPGFHPVEGGGGEVRR